MADQKTQIDFILKIQGVKELRGLTNSLQGLKNTAKNTSLSTRELLQQLNKQSLTATKTINGTRALSNSYKELANAVEFGSQEFKEATAAAARLDAQLKKMQMTSKKGFGSRARGVARGLGAVAAGGIFGGAEGAIGGGIGLIAGGAPGALVGSAVGAQVGMARQQIGEIASFSAQLKLQREALRLVIADTEKFNKAQKFLQKTSKELAIPQNLITRQFTSLTASVTGAGKSVEDAQKVFEAIAAGIRGTGGSLEDMRAAMVATSQVFSKGKVSAEELRQQLGERLPGAFTLFAESMNKTPAELDKALEQGKVTLDDFMAFAEHLFDKYGENAKILADSPAAAGDRLTTAMTELKDNVGQLLQPIGSEFQDTFTKIVEAINPAIKSFVEFTNKLKIQSVEAQIKELEKTLNRGFKIKKPGGLITGGIPFEVDEKERESIKQKINLLKEQLGVLTGIKEEQKMIVEVTEELSFGQEVFISLRNGAQEYLKSIQDVSKQMQDAFVNAFKGMEDALVQFVLTGKLNFKDLARSIIADITRIVVRQQLMTPLLGGINSLFGLDLKLNAKGNAFGANAIIPYAKGGVVSQPQLFKFSTGGSGKLGIMGEGGAPEAILPLKRGRSGNLGVEASGSSNNIVVNVDASGSSVQGDNDNARQFGNVIATAIQSELIKQKRPGGLLA